MTKQYQARFTHTKGAIHFTAILNFELQNPDNKHYTDEQLVNLLAYQIFQARDNNQTITLYHETRRTAHEIKGDLALRHLYKEITTADLGIDLTFEKPADLITRVNDRKSFRRIIRRLEKKDQYLTATLEIEGEVLQFHYSPVTMIWTDEAGTPQTRQTLYKRYF